MTLYWLTNKILVLLTAEHWSRVYQAINVYSARNPLSKKILRVSARVFYSTRVLPHVCFHACTSTRVLPHVCFHETCTLHATSKRGPRKHVTGMQCSILVVPRV